MFKSFKRRTGASIVIAGFITALVAIGIPQSAFADPAPTPSLSNITVTPICTDPHNWPGVKIDADVTVPEGAGTATVSVGTAKYSPIKSQDFTTSGDFATEAGFGDPADWGNMTFNFTLNSVVVDSVTVAVTADLCDPVLTVSTATAAVGDTVTVSGTACPATSTVDAMVSLNVKGQTAAGTAYGLTPNASGYWTANIVIGASTDAGPVTVGQVYKVYAYCSTSPVGDPNYGYQYFDASDNIPTVTIVAAPVPTVTLFVDSASQGGVIHVDGAGFAPNESVQVILHSDPVVLATVNADGAGDISTEVTIPVDTLVGDHEVELLGATSGSAEAPLSVTALASIFSVENISIQPACLFDLPGAVFDMDVKVPDGQHTNVYVAYQIPSVPAGGEPTTLWPTPEAFNTSGHYHAQALIVPGVQTFVVSFADDFVRPENGDHVAQVVVDVPADICATSTPTPSSSSTAVPAADVDKAPPAGGSSAQLASTGGAVDGNWGIAVGGVGLLLLLGAGAVVVSRRTKRVN